MQALITCPFVSRARLGCWELQSTGPAASSSGGMTGDVRILSGLSELKRGLEALGTSQENMSREHADHSDHINRIAFCGSLFGRSFAVFWLDASSKDKLLGESILQLTVEISSRVHAQSLCSAWGMILCAAVRNIAANMGLYIYLYNLKNPDLDRHTPTEVLHTYVVWDAPARVSRQYQTVSRRVSQRGRIYVVCIAANLQAISIQIKMNQPLKVKCSRNPVFSQHKLELEFVDVLAARRSDMFNRKGAKSKPIQSCVPWYGKKTFHQLTRTGSTLPRILQQPTDSKRTECE